MALTIDTATLTKPCMTGADAELDAMLNSEETYRREYAAGGVQNRNHFMTLADKDRLKRDSSFEAANFIDCYEGMFARCNGQYNGNLVFDIDVAGCLDSDAAFKTLQEEQETLRIILTDFLMIPRKSLNVTFSGAKGFHTEVVGSIFLFVKNQPELYKKLALAIKTKCPHLDTFIYDARRLMRVRNSINSKTGLYAIAVPHRYAEVTKRAHLIMMAKTKQPYRNKCKAMTAAERKIVREKIEEVLAWGEEEGLYAASSSNVDKKPAAIPTFENVNIEEEMTREQAIEYVKYAVDMRELVGEHAQYFNCIFHDDKTKSASIMPPTSAHPAWVYHCFSDNCEHDNLDNISVAMLRYDLDFNEALSLLCRMANVSYKSNRSLKKIKDKNYRILSNSKINKAFLDKTIKPLYQKLCNLAVKSAESLKMDSAGEDFICITSTRQVAEAADMDPSWVNRKLAFLAALGLIHKYRDDEVPKSIRGKFFESCEATWGKDHTPQAWSLTDLSNKKNLDYTLATINHWRKSKAEVKKLSYKYQKSVFGPLIADRAYTKPAALPKFRYSLSESIPAA